MSAHHRTLLCAGMLLMSAGGVLVFIVSPLQTGLLLLGVFLGAVGTALFITGLCLAMKNLQVAVPGHFLLHPRTGTRFNPQQAQAIQRRLDRIRREMSSDSVEESPELEPPLPCTPPPWTMEPPPSYDTVMESQQQREQPADSLTHISACGLHEGGAGETPPCSTRVYQVRL